MQNASDLIYVPTCYQQCLLDSIIDHEMIDFFSFLFSRNGNSEIRALGSKIIFRASLFQIND